MLKVICLLQQLWLLRNKEANALRRALLKSNCLRRPLLHVPQALCWAQWVRKHHLVRTFLVQNACFFYRRGAYLRTIQFTETLGNLTGNLAVFTETHARAQKHPWCVLFLGPECPTNGTEKIAHLRQIIDCQFMIQTFHGRQVLPDVYDLLLPHVAGWEVCNLRDQSRYCRFLI